MFTRCTYRDNVLITATLLTGWNCWAATNADHTSSDSVICYTTTATKADSTSSDSVICYTTTGTRTRWIVERWKHRTDTPKRNGRTDGHDRKMTRTDMKKRFRAETEATQRYLRKAKHNVQIWVTDQGDLKF